MRRAPSESSARVAGLVGAACLLLASCTATPAAGGDAGSAGTAIRETHTRVDVDTAGLRRLRADAGIAACRPGRARNDLPDITLPCLGGGRAVDLTRVHGPAVINLFASWCGPCRSEMPYYQDLHRSAAGRLTVLGVDYQDTQPDAALELARRSGVTYPLLADPDSELRADLRVRGLPGIVLVGADGSVHVEYRAFRSYAELRDLVEQRLDVRLPA